MKRQCIGADAPDGHLSGLKVISPVPVLPGFHINQKTYNRLRCERARGQRRSAPMPKILSEEALAEYQDFDEVLKRYPVSRATIIRAVNDGRFPAPAKINGRVRWRIADLTKHDADNAA